MEKDTETLKTLLPEEYGKKEELSPLEIENFSKRVIKDSQSKKSMEEKPAPMEITKGLVPKNIDELWRFSKFLLASKMLPQKSYTTVEQVAGGLQIAMELGLSPMVSLKSIAMVQGTPTIFGDLPLAIVQRSKKLEWIEEFYFDKDYNQISFENKNLHAEAYGAICRVKRFGMPVHERYFTLDDKEKAGLKDYSQQGNETVWFKYTRIMLKFRARTEALKDRMGDVLNGINVAEFDFENGLDGNFNNKKIIKDENFFIDESLLESAPKIAEAVNG
jgi:hypothetical protein